MVELCFLINKFRNSMASRFAAHAALQKNVRNAMSEFQTGSTKWTMPEIVKKLPLDVQHEIRHFPPAVADVRDAYIAQEFFGTRLRSRTRLTIGVTLLLGFLFYSSIKLLGENSDKNKAFADQGRKLVQYTTSQSPALFASAYLAEKDLLDLFNSDVLSKVVSGRTVDPALFATDATAAALRRESDPTNVAYTLQRALPMVEQ